MDIRSPTYTNFCIMHHTDCCTAPFHSFHSAFYIPQFRILPTALPYMQWCIAKNGGGYTQTGVAKGLKVPWLFMITEVSIRCQKNPGGWYTPYTRVYPPIHHCIHVSIFAAMICVFIINTCFLVCRTGQCSSKATHQL